MEYNPDHGEPSPFEPVSRRGHPGIIRPVVPEEIHPFRNSPASLALLDAILPGGYLHDGVTALARHTRVTVRDLRLEMRLGGHHTILVLIDRLPSSVTLRDWRKHSSREYEYRRVQFRFELPEDRVLQASCTVGTSQLEAIGNGWTLGPIINATGGHGAASATWALTCDHPFWPDHKPKDPGHHVCKQIKADGVCISCDATNTLRFSQGYPDDLSAFSFRTHESKCPSAKSRPQPHAIDIRTQITKFLTTHKADLEKKENVFVRKAFQSIDLVTTIQGIFDCSVFVVNLDVPLVCFKLGKVTGFTVGYLYSVVAGSSGKTDVSMASWHMSKSMSAQGDSGSLIFVISGGHIYALSILLGGFNMVNGATDTATGPSLASAIHYAGTQVSSNYILSFQQSKTCVLSKPSPTVWTTPTTTAPAKGTKGTGTKTKTTSGGNSTSAPARPQASAAPPRSRSPPPKKSGGKK